MKMRTLCGTILAAAAMIAGASEVDIDALCPPRPETAAKFKAGAYPPPAMPWRESAMAAYRYMSSLPAMTALVETGKPYRLYQHNAYVSKTHAAHIQAMLLWAREEPERREEAMRLAKASAEFLLGELESPEAVLAFWPPTYGRKPLDFNPETDGPRKRPHMVGNEPEGAVKYRGEVMLVYPANVGSAFLAYHAATKDARFLAAAIGIGETYLKTRRADGSWPLKMKLATGEAVGENTLVPTRTLVFFESLFKATGDMKWRETADQVFAWLEAHPLKDWNWDGQFEDIKPAAPYKNPTKHNAMDAMMYILERFPGDSARLAQCRRLLEFCEKRFVVWSAPPNHAQWPAPSVLEQYSCFTPIDASSAKMIRAYLALYRATGDRELLEKARALGGTVTRVQKPSGRIPTFWGGVNSGDAGTSNERYDWLNCMEAAAAALLELARVDAAVADDGQSDASRMGAAAMNPGGALRCVERIVGGEFRVLVYGNSIALHAPKADIGWTNCWGMAASAAEKDFAHLVVAGLEAKRGKKADFRIRNLAVLERNFTTNIATVAEISADVAWKPDYVVIAIGENSPNIDKLNSDSFQRFLSDIARPFVKNRAKVVLRSPFWRNPAKASCTAKAAAEVGAVYVDAGHLGEKDENKAIGLFSHGGVANHPGDLGMKRLADLILAGFWTRNGEIQGSH